MKPLHWLSVKWVLFSAAMFESNQTWFMKKSCCNTSYVQTSWVAILLLDPATIKTYDYACDFHHWHFCDTSNLDPYTSVWVSTVVGAWEYHLTDKKNRSAFISKMIMHVCSLCHQWLCQSLSGGCNIIALLGWCDFVTVKGTVSANIVDTDNTGQFFCC
jgi:hypothetical protein